MDVTVTAYGWEWYEESEGYCYRETSSVRPNAAAEMFIHYDVTTSTVSRKATDWLQGA